MLNIVTYEGNVVEVRKDIIGNNEDTSFKRNEVDIITRIIRLPQGIIIHFASGKVIDKEDVINCNSWLKRHFKINM